MQDNIKATKTIFYVTAVMEGPDFAIVVKYTRREQSHHKINMILKTQFTSKKAQIGYSVLHKQPTFKLHRY